MKTLTTILLLIFLPSIQAQNSFKIVNKPYVHQQVGCDATDGFQVGDYVYLMESGLIVAVDISNPADMEMVAGIEVETSHHGYGVLNEQYLTIGGMCINISNPRELFIETCTPKKETSTVSYKLNKEGLSVQCKVERGVETVAYLPLPEVEVTINRYGTRFFEINENLLALFYDNLHFIDVSSPEDPQIVGTYTYNIPNAPRTSVSGMQVYDRNTLCVFTGCGIDFIDFQDMEKPKLKGHYLFDMPYNGFNYPNISINIKQGNIIYAQIEGGAEGYCTGKITTLRHQKFQEFEEETIFQIQNGYEIHYLQPLRENQQYSFFIQLDRLIAIDNHIGKVAGELALGNRLLDFDMNDDYVFACGRNEFDSKMVVYQNNGNGKLAYLNVIRDDYRNSCIAVNDDLLVIGGGSFGSNEGFDFQVYDLLNVLNPEFIFNSKPEKYNEKYPPLAHNSITLKNDFLIADVSGYYEARGKHEFNIYDLSNPKKNQLTHQIPCKAYYQFFQFDDTDFWLAYRDSPKTKTVHLTYPILKNGIVEVLQLEYESFEAITKDSKIEGSVREAVKMLYDWNALPKPNSDGFLYKRLSVHKGYVYELQKNKGLRVYKVEEYGRRFEEVKK